MLRRLAFNGIDVRRLGTSVTLDGMTHPVGSWVIPMDQPNANFVRQLFAVQDYPDLREYPEGPPEQPYDVSGWTLPYQFDLRVVEARSPLGNDVRGTLEELRGEPLPWDAEGDARTWDTPPGVGFDSHPVARAIVPPSGAASGGGGALILDPAQNNSYRALVEAWRRGGNARFQPGSAGADGSGGSTGRWIVTGLSGNAQTALVSEYALQAARGGAGGSAVRQPRIGLLSPMECQRGRGLDAVAPRNARHRAHEPVQRRCSRGRVGVTIRRHRLGRPRFQADPRRLREGFGAAAIRGRDRRRRHPRAGRVRARRRDPRHHQQLERARHRSASSSGRERRGRRRARRVLRGRRDRRARRRPVPSGHERDAGTSQGLRRWEPGVHDAGWFRGPGACQVSRPRVPTSVRVLPRGGARAGGTRPRSRWSTAKDGS